MIIFFLNEKRFLFVARIKFAKKYCIFFFDKDYKDLTIQERFYLTYYIFSKDIIKSYTEFQAESNFNIFKKIKFQDFQKLENELIEIENKNISKYNKILDIYHKTSYYKRKK